MGRRKRRKKSSGRKRSKKKGRKPKRMKKPRGKVVYRKKVIRGRSGPRDKYYIALPPGKRISHTGKVYYEYRASHADKKPRKGK